MKNLLTNLPFAILVAMALLAAGSACFAATVDTPAQWVGALATGLASGLGGVYVGTVARFRRQHDRKPRD